MTEKKPEKGDVNALMARASEALAAKNVGVMAFLLGYTIGKLMTCQEYIEQQERELERLYVSKEEVANLIDDTRLHYDTKDGALDAILAALATNW